MMRSRNGMNGCSNCRGLKTSDRVLRLLWYCCIETRKKSGNIYSGPYILQTSKPVLLHAPEPNTQLRSSGHLLHSRRSATVALQWAFQGKVLLICLLRTMTHALSPKVRRQPGSSFRQQRGRWTESCVIEGSYNLNIPIGAKYPKIILSLGFGASTLPKISLQTYYPKAKC